MRSFARITAIAALSLALPTSVFAQDALETEQDKLSYVLGMDVGNSLKQLNTDFNLDAMMQGIKTVLESGETLLDAAEAEAIKQAFF